MCGEALMRFPRPSGPRAVDNGVAEHVLIPLHEVQADGSAGEVCSPKEVAALEPLLPPRVTNIWCRLFSWEPMPTLTMGARLSALVCLSLKAPAHSVPPIQKYSFLWSREIVSLTLAAMHESIRGPSGPFLQ